MLPPGGTGVALWCESQFSISKRPASELTAPAPWLDTWRCALHVWPDARLHSLRYLHEYELGLPAPEREAGVAPNAAADCRRCQDLFKAMLAAGATLDDMARWSREPPVEGKEPAVTEA
jgi:exodeoxyribonuclease X